MPKTREFDERTYTQATADEMPHGNVPELQKEKIMERLYTEIDGIIIECMEEKGTEPEILLKVSNFLRQLTAQSYESTYYRDVQNDITRSPSKGEVKDHGTLESCITKISTLLRTDLAGYIETRQGILEEKMADSRIKKITIELMGDRRKLEEEIRQNINDAKTQGEKSSIKIRNTVFEQCMGTIENRVAQRLKEILEAAEGARMGIMTACARIFEEEMEG